MEHAPQHIEFAGFRCRIGQRGSDWPTAKQAMVLAGLAAGMTHKEIARERGISPNTVKSTAEAIYHRLHASRAAGAIVKGMRRGWIAPLAIALFISALNPNADAIRRPPSRGRQQISITTRPSRQDNGGLYA